MIHRTIKVSDAVTIQQLTVRLTNLFYFRYAVMECFQIFGNQPAVLFFFSAIEPDNGIEIFQLPFAPFVEGAVNFSIIVAGIDEKNFIFQRFRFAFVKEPERTGQTFRIKEVVANADHCINVPGFDQFFADVLSLP